MLQMKVKKIQLDRYHYTGTSLHFALNTVKSTILQIHNSQKCRLTLIKRVTLKSK